MKSILLDLDGTLVNTKEGIFNAVKYTADKNKWQLPDEETLNAFIGPPLNLMFQKVYGLTAEGGNKAVEDYREYYSVKGKFECELYDGIYDLLNNKNYKFYVATGKPTVFTLDILQKLGIISYFSGIQGSELDHSLDKKADIIRVLTEKYDIQKEDAVMVGDTYFDCEGAAENQIDFIWASWGFGILKEGDPLKIAETPADILKYV